MKESNANTKDTKQKRISNKTCTHRITRTDKNKYDNSLNQGLENRQAFKEYKKLQRIIQKLIRRKRNHSNVLTKQTTRNINQSWVVVRINSQIIQKGKI